MPAPPNHTSLMLRKNDRTLSRRVRVPVGLLLCVIAAGLLTPTVVDSQVTPLQDIVPLDELEIRAGDLVDLTTSQADAVRELKTAQLSAKTLQALRPSASVTNLEMQIAQLNVQAAENKVRILRAIAEAQLATAQAKLEFLRRIGNGQVGDGVSPRIQQAEATVRVLQMIVDIK